MKLLICTQAVSRTHPILGFFHGWIEEFSRHFDEVHVICLEKGEYELPSNVYVYSLGKEEGESRLKYAFRFYRHFAHIFFNIRVDYAFFHMGAIYNILAAPFFVLRKMFATRFYWWKAHGHISLMSKFALLFVDRVYTSTESGFPVATGKRFVVGQAIDTSLFVMPQEDLKRKDQVVFVGRIMPVKHIEEFISTARMLLEEHQSLLFCIVGPVGDQAYYEKLVAQIASLNLEEHVTFAGAKTQEELVAIYQQSRIFLNTSLTHSMDKTVLEASLCGCIPVTGNRAFINLLSHEALFASEATPEQYARIISTMLNRENDALQARLQKEIIVQHSLQTFCGRIFNV